MVGFSSSRPVRKLPSRIGGKYRPIRVIGRGGMSVVYEVEHEFTKDRLALKVLQGTGVLRDPMALARFRREARVSALVRNEHIVRVFDADIAADLNGAPFLVMDLLRGKSLAAVARSEPQAPERVVEWLRQVARGLDLAHQHGVVHRDLKPENLFLVESSEGNRSIKVLDFGVASIPALDEASGTATGAFVGTPLFMSPEQAAGGDVGPSADMWSVGICAFRLLTGRNYWEAPNVNLLLAKIVYEAVAPPSQRGLELGEAFDAWFLRSCARSPSDRWSSVGLQVEALAAAVGLPVLDVPTTRLAGRAGMASYPDLDVDSEREQHSDSLGAAVTTSASDGFSRSGLLAAAALVAAAVTVALLFQRGSETGGRAAESLPPPTVVPPAASTELVQPTGLPSAGPSAPPPAASAPTESARQPRVERQVPSRAPRRPTSAPLAPSSGRVPAENGTVTPTSATASPAPPPTLELRRDPLADPD